MDAALPLVSLSIVSHGQGPLIRDLLNDLQTLSGTPFEIILTLNIPEDEIFLAPFVDLPLRVVRNTAVKGFGANHNAAFAITRGSVFVIVNPDIRAPALTLEPLLAVLDRPGVGVCAPVVLAPSGTAEDSVRRFPTLARLAFRLVSRRRRPDYRWDNEPIEVDWTAGMFVAYRSCAFREVGGFDERFFMYLEDADICRRLRAAGWATMLQPACRVIHAAQRKSHRSLQHLAWHARSALLYFFGPRAT
jgi:N-acetylglucosaminyl-diphospho-decaprenol L-rhamnosyltransferase